MIDQQKIAGIGMTSRRTRERLIQRLIEQGISDSRVLDVILMTPRHLFIDEALAHRAYEDASLPIGYNQTLSQPYIVARMTELLLEAGPLQRVLEIGSGSGYQTAVLAQLVGQVYGMERIRPLLDRARERIRLFGLNNVTLSHSDGTLGSPSRAPFDGILSAAAPREIPVDLIEQLQVGGRMVIPVGDDRNQKLCLVVRTTKGHDVTEIEPVRFVPLLGGVTR